MTVESFPLNTSELKFRIGESALIQTVEFTSLSLGEYSKANIFPPLYRSTTTHSANISMLQDAREIGGPK